MSTLYDAVDYPTLPRILGHPGHMHAVARMFGVPAPAVANSRMLEIGCGDGFHLISCAVSVPQATFVGFDLSREAIARGKAIVSRLGQTNIRLEDGDITTWQPDEPFDFILVHGVYSWVPEFVREALLQLIASALSPSGVACVSYNAYPASYTRQMLWEMMKYHVGERNDPKEMIDKAIELAEFIQLCRPKMEGEELELFDNDVDIVINKQIRSVLYHDELAPINQPFYFHEFAAHARHHGLRFVSELEPHVMTNGEFPQAINTLLQTLSHVNPERREQYYDFACLRRFRQTLIAKSPHEPKGIPDPHAIRELYIAGNCVAGSVDFAADEPMVFMAGETAINVDGPLAKAVMLVLVDERPRRFRFDELVSFACAKIGRESITKEEEEVLLRDLTTAWLTGLVVLKGYVPDYEVTPGERPIASPFARFQLEQSSSATTLLMLNLNFADDIGRMMVQQLDGTRTLEDIVDELHQKFKNETDLSKDQLRTVLQQNLEKLARGGLLLPSHAHA